jgi:hypothetical protein
MDLMDNVDDIVFCLMVCVGAIALSFLLRNAWGKLGAAPAVNMIAYEVIATAEVTVVSSELCFIGKEIYERCFCTFSRTIKKVHDIF